MTSISRVVLGLLRRLFGNWLEPTEQLIYKQYNDYPLGRKLRATTEDYVQIWQQVKTIQYPLVDDFEAQTNNKIDKQWLDDLALLTQVVIKKSDICYQHGRLLYAVLSGYVKNNQDQSHLRIVETGTARGFSSLCMAKALEDNKVCGQIVTIDVLPHDVKIFWNCIVDETGPQTRQQLLEDYQKLIEKYIIFIQGDTTRELRKIKFPRVNFAFLDAGHTYDQVWSEFECIQGCQYPGDVIFFDDYTPAIYPDVVNAVNEICQQGKYSKQVLTLTEQRGYAIARKLA